jgi:hypothetical protein
MPSPGPQMRNMLKAGSDVSGHCENMDVESFSVPHNSMFQGLVVLARRLVVLHTPKL